MHKKNIILIMEKSITFGLQLPIILATQQTRILAINTCFQKNLFKIYFLDGK